MFNKKSIYYSFFTYFLFLASFLTASDSIPNQSNYLDVSNISVSDSVIDEILQMSSIEELKISTAPEQGWNNHLADKLFSGSFPNLDRLHIVSSKGMDTFFRNSNFAKNLTYISIEDTFLADMERGAPGLNGLNNFEKLEYVNISESSLYSFEYDFYDPIPYSRKVHISLPNLKEIYMDSNTYGPWDHNNPTNFDLDVLDTFSFMTPKLNKLSIKNLQLHSWGWDLTYFPNIPSLKSLDLSITRSHVETDWGPYLKNHHVVAIKNGAPMLSELSLAKRNLSGNIDLSILSNLEILDLSGCAISTQTYMSLYNLLNLKKLNLSYLRNSYFSISDIETLKQALPNCQIIGVDEDPTKHFDFSGKISDNGMQDIIYMTQLQTLDMSHVTWRAASASEFFEKGKFPLLKTLNLNHPKTTKIFPLLLFSSFAENLENLSMQGVDFTGSNLKDLAQLASLRVLDLCYATFGPEHIEQTQLTSLEMLEELKLDYTKFRKAAFEIFSPNLKHLSLKGSNITSSDVSRISNILNLETLNLSSTSISAASIKKLAKLPSLKELSLADTDMSKADFSLMQNLETFDLSQCILSVQSFISLQNLKNLKELCLKGIINKNISDEMIQDLQAALPNCVIKLS